VRSAAASLDGLTCDLVEHHGRFIELHLALLCRAVLAGRFDLAGVADVNLWSAADILVEAVERLRGAPLG
jgi:hypothetical protein